MSCQTKCKFLRNHFCIIDNFAKNTAIFCGNVHCAKHTVDLTPQILLLTQNITTQCTLCILLVGGGGGGSFVIKKNCVVDFVGYFDGKKLQIFGKKGGGTQIRNNFLPVLVTPEKDQHCFPKQHGWGGGSQRLLGSFFFRKFIQISESRRPFPSYRIFRAFSSLLTCYARCQKLVFRFHLLSLYLTEAVIVS